MSWEEQLDKLLTKEELKEVLPIENVLYEELGVELDQYGKGHCPFHDDADPSFAVFESEDGHHRAGCWSCEWRGDIYDVIQTARDCGFNDAVSVAREIFSRLGAVRRGPKHTKIRPSRHVLQETVEASWQRPSDPIQNFIRAKGLPFDVDYLRYEWRIGVESTVGIGSICIPHCDRDGWVTAYKVRTPYTPTIAASGSKFEYLYGIWRVDKRLPVLLVEGESDAWFAQYVLPEYRVLAVPTGAQTPIRSGWLEMLADSDVTLCFDGDDAGYQATVRWARALGAATIIRLDEGKDCVETGKALRDYVLAG